MSELPQGWEIASLGDICGTGQYGWTTKAANQGYIKYLRTTDITKGRIDWHSVPYCHETPSELDKYLIQDNDILISRAGSVGFSTLIKDIPFPTVFASYLIRFIPYKNIESRYVAYSLRSAEYWQQISDASTGIALANVNAKKLAKFRIPIAPLNEQKRIADKLNDLLARVDACRKRLDRIPLILKRFRQSVFDAATSGQLIEDWQNVSEHQDISLIQPESSAVHKPIGQHQDARWHKALIGDLLVEKPRNGYSPRPVEFETATRSLTLTATTSGRFNSKFFKYINETITEDSHLWLQPGDILIQRANTLEYVGVSAIYHGPSSSYIYPDLMMKCRANSKVLTDFLYYLLSSSTVRDYFRTNATGTSGNMPKINQQTVISVPVRIPSIDEQQEIVRRVESLFAYADRLEARYKNARAQVERLTPVLLAKAFRGELVPQDPNDEPASVLLDRIRAERAAQPPKPKRTQASRKKTMTKITEESVKKAISQLPKDEFSFDELRENFPGDYDSLKDILFALLSEAEPSLTQVFDREERAICFVRAGK